MGNCLKTQLKENVNNDNLLKIGEVAFIVKDVTENSYLEFDFFEQFATPVKHFIFSNPVTLKNHSTHETIASNVTSYDLPGNINVEIYPQVGLTTKISLAEKYTSKLLNLYLTGSMSIQMAGFDYINTIQDIKFNTATEVTGLDLSAFTNCANLRQLNTNGGSVSGDVSVFNDKTKLYNIDFNTLGYYKLPITGNINDFSAAVNAVLLGVRDTNITGNADTLLDAFAASGRTTALNLVIDVKNIQMTDKKNISNHTIRFNSGMVNPTEAETARGWQVAN